MILRTALSTIEPVIGKVSACGEENASEDVQVLLDVIEHVEPGAALSGPLAQQQRSRQVSLPQRGWRAAPDCRRRVSGGPRWR